ncbi:hypothetical protein [Akkermansia sp.]|uniref:hypothetical protein n=1 Tax=Akkermansia sp. TaxID=1872421 RepID=UPI00399395FB
MNSIIKPTLCALALGVCGAAPLCAASATASCEQTHSVLYAGGVSQAIMKIKITAPETSQILKGMTFSMAGTTSVADIAKAQIFASGTTPFFSPDRARPTAAPSPSSTPFPRARKPSSLKEAIPSPPETTISGCAWTLPPERAA